MYAGQFLTLKNGFFHAAMEEDGNFVLYRAVGKVKFSGYPDKLPVYAEGVYEGVTTHDVTTWWKETSEHEEPAVNAVAAAGLPDDGWKLLGRVEV